MIEMEEQLLTKGGSSQRFNTPPTIQNTNIHVHQAVGLKVNNANDVRIDTQVNV